MKFIKAAALIACMLLPAIEGNAQSQPTQIGLTDLKLDLDTLRGKVVRVDGIIQTMGDFLFLKSSSMDTSPIWVEGKKLSRDDRKALITNCSTICRATIVGRVTTTQIGQLGLEATRITDVKSLGLFD